MTDFNKEMKEILLRIDARERLLLHCCCGVCAGGVLAREFRLGEQVRRLGDFFDITLYFYNPNLDSAFEHDKRAIELEKLRGQCGVAEIVFAPYTPKVFDARVKGYETQREGGERCELCFALRLEQSARYAAEHGYRFVASTLSVSPHKNAVSVNKIGAESAQANGVSWLSADFKKENGTKVSTQMANQLGMYRQSYCGCAFSRLGKP